MRFSLLVALALATFCQAGYFKGITSDYSFGLSQDDLYDWMSRIRNDAPVSSLSIPGTHNSMTYSLTENKNLQGQLDTLARQLKGGIRFIDIGSRRNGEKIGVFHGGTYTEHDLDEVFSVVFGFLDYYESESVIMRIHKDSWPLGESSAFKNNMNRYLGPTGQFKDSVKNRLYTHPGPYDTWAPKMGDIRGKLVILQDFSTKPAGRFGIPWKSSSISATEWKISKGRVGVNYKWSSIETGIRAANEDTENKLHITYTGVSFGTAPFMAAGGKSLNQKGMNDMLGEFLKDDNVDRAGIVAVDFPGDKLVREILKRNRPFCYGSPSSS
ncbi:hypothetical protein BROUX41_000773 [Berkeleyomyces rouxiae]|uniref:uncharacterized protein n=1 Tax=Berkeleyomyces rouxiae TaxID=2035830 RepID=UPI003B7EC24A